MPVIGHAAPQVGRVEEAARRVQHGRRRAAIVGARRAPGRPGPRSPRWPSGSVTRPRPPCRRRPRRWPAAVGCRIDRRRLAVGRAVRAQQAQWVRGAATRIRRAPGPPARPRQVASRASSRCSRAGAPAASLPRRPGFQRLGGRAQQRLVDALGVVARLGAHVGHRRAHAPHRRRAAPRAEVSRHAVPFASDQPRPSRSAAPARPGQRAAAPADAASARAAGTAGTAIRGPPGAPAAAPAAPAPSHSRTRRPRPSPAAPSAARPGCARSTGPARARQRPRTAGPPPAAEIRAAISSRSSSAGEPG